MTKGQRITLMAEWWPNACSVAGWNEHDRALRLDHLSRAVPNSPFSNPPPRLRVVGYFENER